MNDYEAFESVCQHFKTFYNNALTNGLSDLNILPLTFEDLAGDSYVPEIEWQRVMTANRAPHDKHWMRFSMKNVTSKQRTLADTNQTIRYTSYGIIVMQIFLSKSTFQQYECSCLEMIVQRAFMKSTVGGIIFRNATIKKLAEDVDYFQTNVVCDYEFDTTIR